MSQIEILDCFDRTGRSGSVADGPSRAEPTLSAADIVARTKLPRSSVFRDLKSLTSSGFVYQDPLSKRYALGPRVLQLGLTARRQLSSEDQVVVPLVDLMSQTSESVTFSIVDVPWRTCVYMIEAPSELRHFVQVGTRYPLHLGAAGKVILAFLPTDVAAAALKAHGVSRSQTADVINQLAQIRSRGYAITSGERVAGASSVAAPVFVARSIYGSVAVAGPTDRFNGHLDKHQRLVVEAARRLTDRLGSRPADGLAATSSSTVTVVAKPRRPRARSV